MKKLKINVSEILFIIFFVAFSGEISASPFQEVPETEKEYIQEIEDGFGERPDAYMLYHGYHLAKAKKFYRMGELKETLKYIDKLRLKLLEIEGIEEVERRHEGLVLDYFEIDVYETLGDVDKAKSLGGVFSEKEKIIEDRSGYNGRMMTIKMQLSVIHSLRGNMEKADGGWKESRDVIKEIFSSEVENEEVEVFFDAMMEMAIAAQAQSKGDIGESENILQKSGDKFDVLLERLSESNNHVEPIHNPLGGIVGAIKVTALIESGREKEALEKIDSILSQEFNGDIKYGHGCDNYKDIERILSDETVVGEVDHIHEGLAVQKLVLCGAEETAINVLKSIIGSNKYDFENRPLVSAGRLNSLAEILISSEDYQEAKEALLKSLEYQQKVTGLGSLDQVRTELKLAWINIISDSVEEGEISYKALLDELESKVGQAHPDYIDAANNYIAYLGKEKRYDEVMQYTSKIESGLHSFFSKEFQWKKKTDERSRVALLGKYWQYVDLLFSLILRVDDSGVKRELVNKLLLWKNITLEGSFSLEKLMEYNGGEKAIDQIEKKLEGRVLLEYKKFRPYDFDAFKFKEETYGVCVIGGDRDGVDCVNLSDSISIEKAITNKNKGDSLRELFDLLIYPLNVGVDTSEIFISPDGVLNLISMSSLIGHEGKYLVQKHLVRYVLSGRHLIRQLPKNKDEKSKYTGIGGIDYGGDSPYKPLPLSGSEVEEVKLYFDIKEIPTQLITKKQVSKESVKLALEGSKYLHIASHAKFEEPNDQFITNYSSLAKIALSGANYNNASFINGNDILGMDLLGLDLVALSACDTGKGKLTRADGMYGLLRSFYIGGAANTLASLWLVEDREGYEFMTDFFPNILENPKYLYAESIRDTQLSIIKRNPSVENIQNWARFVLFEHDGISTFHSSKVNFKSPKALTSSNSDDMIVRQSHSKINDLVWSIQKELIRLGYKVNILDGIYGSNTKNAITEYEITHNLQITGEASYQLLEHLVSMNEIPEKHQGKVQEQSPGSAIEEVASDALEEIQKGGQELIDKLEILKNIFK